MASEVTVRLPEGWMPSDPPSICCFEHWQKTGRYGFGGTPVNPDYPVGAVHPPYMVVPIMWGDEMAAQERAKRAASFPAPATAGTDRAASEGGEG